MTEPTTEALAMFKVMLAAKPAHIDGLSRSSLGEWCENVVAAGYVLAEAGPTREDWEAAGFKVAPNGSVHVASPQTPATACPDQWHRVSLAACPTCGLPDTGYDKGRADALREAADAIEAEIAIVYDRTLTAETVEAAKALHEVLDRLRALHAILAEPSDGDRRRASLDVDVLARALRRSGLMRRYEDYAEMVPTMKRGPEPSLDKSWAEQIAAEYRAILDAQP